MTYEVQQTRWDRIIRRVSGSIGPGSRVSETLSELFPVLDVERVPGELLLLGGTGLANGGGTITAGGGNGARAQLFNPAGSNMLITLTRVHVSVTGTTTMRWGTGFTQIGTVISTQIFRDTRRGQPPPVLPVGQVSQLASAALAVATNQSRLLANVNLQIRDENSVAVLAPGSGFEIGTAQAANTLHYTFYWRERPAEESELSL